MSSAFMLNVLMSGVQLHRWGQLDASGLVNFGKFNDDKITHLWDVVDLVFFILMGAGGGLLGALFNEINKRITLYRMKHVRTKKQKLAEAVLVATVATSFVFIFAMTLGQCRPLPHSTNSEFNKDARSFFCEDTEYNDMATLAFNPQEVTIKALFHLDGHFAMRTLGLYFVMFFFVACWTYGVAIPSGLFVPCIVTGAAYGRLVGSLIQHMLPGYSKTYLGTYALIGAASFLGGVVRMTISLTVILIESTDEISLGLPLMVSLMVAKWVGDLFNEGLYDIHIELRHIPLLEWEPTETMKQFKARDIMAHHPVCFMEVERVGDIVDILRSCDHMGFPVVRPRVVQGQSGQPAHHRGEFRGLILRSQLCVLLQEQCYGVRRDAAVLARTLSEEDFVRYYPFGTKRMAAALDAVPAEAMDLYMDISPYMSSSPYTVYSHTSLTRVFNIFRTMGLRHLVVLDQENNAAVGIVTRKDLAHVSAGSIVVKRARDHPHDGAGAGSDDDSDNDGDGELLLAHPGGDRGV
jgi:CBS domain-containing protein